MSDYSIKEQHNGIDAWVVVLEPSSSPHGLVDEATEGARTRSSDHNNAEEEMTMPTNLYE